MRLLALIPFLSNAVMTLAVDVTLNLPMHPNPFSLSPATHATLTSLGQRFSAPISAANTFVFRNVTVGSYLADVHCPTDGFQPLRIDVVEGDVVLGWETYRGNDWDNKGPAVAANEAGEKHKFQLRALGGKGYFIERPKCKHAEDA